jgi:hypothetical protein
MGIKIFGIILILIIALISMFSVIWYTSLLKPDTIKLLDEMYRKHFEIKKYSLNYSVTGKLSLDGISIQIKGSANAVSINKSLRIVAEFNLPWQYSEFFTSTQGSSNQKFESQFYSIPEGKIECIKSFSIIEPRYECREIESENIMEEQMTMPQFQVDLLKNWTKRGIVSVSLEGTRKIIGRECYNFKFDANAEKLAEELNYSMYFRERSVNATIFQCLDKEFGLPLYSQLVLAANVTYGGYRFFQEIEIRTEASALSFDVGIDKIELPLPLEKVKWLPTFTIVETSCKANLNEVKVAIKPRKDIFGKAILNLVESKIESIYLYKNVTGYEHYCFMLSDIASSTSLSFMFRSVNDSYGRMFIIGIDCPEVKGKRVYPSFGKCEKCEKGKYCSMSSFDSYASYIFDLDLPGSHEICVWPTSERGYLWSLDFITIERKVKLTSEIDLEKISKGKISILNFTIPSYLSKNKYYTINLTINNSTSSSYCSTYERYSLPLTQLTGSFVNVLEKLFKRE